MGLGEKGMLYAAKILAATTLDYMTKPELLEEIRKRVGGEDRRIRLRPHRPGGTETAKNLRRGLGCVGNCDEVRTDGCASGPFPP